MYDNTKHRKHKLTDTGYDVTLYKNYEDKFCITIIYPDRTRAMITAENLCEANHEYNEILRMYA